MFCRCRRGFTRTPPPLPNEITLIWRVSLVMPFVLEGGRERASVVRIRLGGTRERRMGAERSGCARTHRTRPVYDAQLKHQTIGGWVARIRVFGASHAQHVHTIRKYVHTYSTCAKDTGFCLHSERDRWIGNQMRKEGNESCAVLDALSCFIRHAERAACSSLSLSRR